ncbi:UNVERIFIED_CONTAM: hypothetical protein FKN15_035296 [Acipenser sinensis]
MEDTMWLIAITFLTIGYGDITPQTTCGKTVCLLTGVMVGTRFRAERNLRSGFTHFQGVGCTAMLVAVVAKNLSLNKAEKHVHQFMMDIKHTKKARLKQRKLRDHANEMVDLSKLQVMMCDLSGNWSTSYKEMERRIGSMEQKMDELSRAFQETSQLISRALQHRAGDNSVA